MKGRDIFVYLESRGIVNNLVNGVLFTGKDFIAAKWNKNTEQADSRSGRCPMTFGTCTLYTAYKPQK